MAERSAEGVPPQFDPAMAQAYVQMVQCPDLTRPRFFGTGQTQNSDEPDQ